MSTQFDLVKALEKRGAIKSVRVAAVMNAVDRGHFVEKNPYEDKPKSFACNANISAPHMHAWALEYLKDYLEPGNRALDVGSGSGYLTACMAMLVGEKGCVFGIEHIPDLLALSLKCIEKFMTKPLISGQIQFVYGDGRNGYTEGGPYDAIHVGGAVENIPQALIDQLKPGGRMILPVGPVDKDQMYKVVDKDKDGGVKVKDIMGVIYQSLGDTQKQWPDAPKLPDTAPVNTYPFYAKENQNKKYKK